jgi:SAM-dependent methyltransferase
MFMTDPDYEYYGLMAQTWDLFRGDTSQWEDRFFFIDIIRESGQPALDVGCGTGRLLLDYLSQGVDIDGVDNSSEMLKLCKQKAEVMGLHPVLFEGSMEALNLPRRYRTIIVPSSSFQLVLDPALARQAMQRFFDHLLPGGVLAMPFMRLWKMGDPLETDWEQNGEKVRPEDGAVMRRWSRSRYDPDTQLEHNWDRYEVIREGIIVASEHHKRSPATREYTHQQALDLYEDAGFVDVRMYKEFTRQQAAEEDRIFSIIGKRP